MRIISRLCLLLLVVSFVLSQKMSAATVTVCDEASLRAAITNGGAINFGCDGTIVLSSTLQITTNTVLDGTGHNVVLSGGDAVRVLFVATNINLTITNVTIANGNQQGTNIAGTVTGAPAFGAGIFNDGGHIALFGCVLSNNLASGADESDLTMPAGGGDALGGAVFSNGGSILINNCVFSRNSCRGGGGRLWTNDSLAGIAKGGAIYSQGGPVSISNCDFESNIALGGTAAKFESIPWTLGGSGFGGALFIEAGEIELMQSHFSNNQATGGDILSFGIAGRGRGGGAYLTNCSAKISLCQFVTNSSVSGNNLFGPAGGASDGGAILNDGNLTLSDTLFTGNQAVGGTGASGQGFSPDGGSEATGGAICNIGTLTINRNTMVANIARGGLGGPAQFFDAFAGGDGRGGAIYNGGTLCLTNSTIVSNLAQGGFGGEPRPPFGEIGQSGNGEGAGICNQGELTLVHSTIALNGAWPANQANHKGIGLGGGIFTTNGTSTLQNSIIANSLSPSNCFGVLIDNGNNLSSDASCQFTALGSLNNTDPLLSPLDDFGGPTPTMALLAGSPAIDHSLAIYCPAADQRGIARPFGNGCDIGAFESAPPYSVRGFVHGSATAGSVSISNGTTTNTISAPGRYLVGGMLPGTFTITPTASNGVVIPNNLTVTVGPDIVDLDFKVYRLNAITIESYTNQILHLIFAGTNGQSCQVQTTTNLFNWTSIVTNQVGTNGIFDFFYTNDLAEPFRSFQTYTP